MERVISAWNNEGDLDVGLKWLRVGRFSPP